MFHRAGKQRVALAQRVAVCARAVVATVSLRTGRGRAASADKQTADAFAPAAPPRSAARKLQSATSTFLNCQGSLVSMSSGNSPRPAGERRPVGVVAGYRAEIGPLDLEAAAEVHLVGLDQAAVRVLQHPDDAGEHRRGDLQAGRVLVGRELAGLLDRELRAVPVGVLGVAVEQDAELVDAVDDLVLVQDLPLRLPLPRRRRPSRAATARRRRTGGRRSGRSAGRPPCRPRAP